MATKSATTKARREPTTRQRTKVGAAAKGNLTSVPSTTRDSEDAKFGRLVYERVRLGIMSALAVNDALTFSDLKSLFDVSDGNLSAHARKLEDAGYVACTKTFTDR